MIVVIDDLRIFPDEIDKIDEIDGQEVDEKQLNDMLTLENSEENNIKSLNF